MKVIKSFVKLFLALSCVLQVILLSLSIVSPGIHSGAFHGGHELDFKGVCCKHDCSHDDRTSFPHEPITHDDYSCSVSLFSIGITLLPVTHLVVERLPVTQGCIREMHGAIGVQRQFGVGSPRAPPIA